MLKLRNGFTPEKISEASGQLAQQLIDCSPMLTAITVMTYAPFGSELNPNLFLEFQSGGPFATDAMHIVYPRVLDENTMEAYTCSPSELLPGYHTIEEPPHTAPLCQPPTIDVVLVPGVAFDKHGYRIGYGKGYYDRFLGSLLDQSGRRPALIGITYAETIVPDALPAPHDIAMDYLVTPHAIIDCRGSRS